MSQSRTLAEQEEATRRERNATTCLLCGDGERDTEDPFIFIEPDRRAHRSCAARAARVVFDMRMGLDVIAAGVALSGVASYCTAHQVKVEFDGRGL